MTHVRKVLPVVAVGGTVIALFAAAFAAGSLNRLISTIITTFIAIGVVFAVWLVGNVLLSQARSRWPVFVGLSWGLLAAILFGVMRGNEVITALFVEEDPIAFGAGSGFLGHVEWSVFGAVLWGGGTFIMSRLSNRPARIAIGALLGAVTGWLIAANSLIWQRPSFAWSDAIGWALGGAAVAVLIRLRHPLRQWLRNRLDRRRNEDNGAVNALPDTADDRPAALFTSLIELAPSALVGATAGWMIAVWLRAPFVPSLDAPYAAAIIPLVAIGVRLGWREQPHPSQIASFEERGRAILFLGPALLFLSAALVIPAFGTIRLSFLDALAEEPVGWRNYREYFARDDAFDVSRWSNIFGSQLFWVAVALLAAGLLYGVLTGSIRNGELAFERSGGSIGALGLGTFVLLTAAFSVLRGTFFNNLWWIVTVTVMSVVLGLLVAVLAERAGRFESVAKSLIFMPLAVSFVGASIIWRLQYQARPVSKSQTGLLNWTWIKLGELSHSGWPRLVVLLVLLALLVRLCMQIYRRATAGDSAAAPVGAAVVLIYLFYQLLTRSLGGFTIGQGGEVGPEFVLFIQNPPFNNVFLMIILIWLQTGFAMVLLSAAIKAVPAEYIEAAKVDGATESQTFFNITLPTILPTIGVITTTLIVLVTKVFDIVQVTTNGNFGTNVLANDFYRFFTADRGLSSAIATIILLLVLPVMILNVRRMQKARTA